MILIQEYLKNWIAYQVAESRYFKWLRANFKIVSFDNSEISSSMKYCVFVQRLLSGNQRNMQLLFAFNEVLTNYN